MTIDQFIMTIRGKLPPAPPEELAEFEKAIGHVLTDDYRRFLIACKGGHLGGALWFASPTPEGKTADAAIHHIGGFREESYYSLDFHRDCYDGRIPEALLWVMGDPFGNAICLGLSGSHHGLMYFWDHENEPDEDWDGQVETAGNIELLANSFAEFVSGLQSTE